MTAPEPPAPGGDIRALHEILSDLHGVEVRREEYGIHDDATFAIVPKGKTIVSLKPILEEFAGQPRRRVATVRVDTAAALIALTKRHSHEHTTVVFARADRLKPALITVFDYHPDNASVADARVGQHRALYECPLAEEWQIWQKAHGQWMGQADFAQFVEDRFTEVVAVPEGDAALLGLATSLQGRYATPQELMTLSRGLQVHSDITVRSAVKLQSGEISIAYEDRHRDSAGGQLQIPDLFSIAIPVFMRGDTYRIAVRLRYQVANGSLKWSFHLYRADRSFDHAFNEILEDVREQTAAPVYLGWPGEK